MTTDQVLAAARKCLGGPMESSARLCLAEAVEARNSGDFLTALRRGRDSLRYSVGVFHADYKKAARECDLWS